MRLTPSSYLRWLPSLLWMALIFLGSTDLLSANHTSRFVEPFLRWLSHGTLSAQQIDHLHFLIRKTGHLCEYAVLCVSFWWALRPSMNTRPGWHRAIFALGLAATFAASDEFHQSFVPTRTASVRDVLIDTTGAIIGLASLLAISTVIQSLRRPSKTTCAP